MHGVLFAIAVVVLIVWLVLFMMRVTFKIFHILLVVAAAFVLWGLLTH
jgi:hypothetical protein